LLIADSASHYFSRSVLYADTSIHHHRRRRRRLKIVVIIKAINGNQLAMANIHDESVSAHLLFLQHLYFFSA
jgi:hypothetical protein